MGPSSRAREAFRRVTADGYFHPHARQATRYFVLPITLLGIFVLLVPLTIAKLAITVVQALHMNLSPDECTKLYRYAYPMAAGWGLVGAGTTALGMATTRWRSKIRDEVYLVGERLHNFGEARPPVGSRTMVRKDK